MSHCSCSRLRAGAQLVSWTRRRGSTASSAARRRASRVPRRARGQPWVTSTRSGSRSSRGFSVGMKRSRYQRVRCSVSRSCSQTRSRSPCLDHRVAEGERLVRGDPERLLLPTRAADRVGADAGGKLGLGRRPGGSRRAWRGGSHRPRVPRSCSACRAFRAAAPRRARGTGSSISTAIPSLPPWASTGLAAPAPGRLAATGRSAAARRRS